MNGSVYLNYRNSALNARDYSLTGQEVSKPLQIQNNFGGSIGGPILLNKTFFFANYEGRRLPQTLPVNRLVPTATLKQGLLRFVDATGVVRSYDVKAYDPRGLGLSPVVQGLWNRLPAGNNPGAGD